MGEKQRIFHPGELGKIILSPYIFVFCIERVAHVGALQPHGQPVALHKGIRKSWDAFEFQTYALVGSGSRRKFWHEYVVFRDAFTRHTSDSVCPSQTIFLDSPTLHSCILINCFEEATHYLQFHPFLVPFHKPYLFG